MNCALCLDRQVLKCNTGKLRCEVFDNLNVFKIIVYVGEGKGMSKKNRKTISIKISKKHTNKMPKCQAIPFTVGGVKWEIHNRDADINDSSCPHMHAIGKPWKLDIYTGNIYDIKSKQIIKKLTRKELKRIWNAKGVMKIILMERVLYYSEYHAIDPIRYPELPKLPSFKKNKCYSKTIMYTHESSTARNDTRKASTNIKINYVHSRIRRIILKCKRLIH